jgi:hypothetical protein
LNKFFKTSKIKNFILSNNFLDFQIFAPIETEELLQQCFGNNNKHLLIISRKSEQDTELWDLLQKILGAVKYDLKNDAIHLVLQPNQQFCLADLLKKHSIKKIISFGIAPKTAGLNFDVTPISRSYLTIKLICSCIT